MHNDLNRMLQHIQANPDDLRCILAAKDDDARIRAAADLARKLGLALSEDTFRKVLAARAEGELKDEELEAVAAGKSYIYLETNSILGNEYITNYTDSDESTHIIATSQDDTVHGAGGDDFIEGGQGDDVLHGDEGDDMVDGGSGDDTVYGDEGNDILLGGRGDDELSGGTGNDLLLGEEGNDVLSGDSGDDTLIGGEGRDELYGGEGNDILDGGLGNDTIDGGSGNDILLGGFGDDRLDGGSGNDIVGGGFGNDTLYGGRGDDVLIGGDGQDVFTFGFNDGNDVIADFAPGQDRLQFSGLVSADQLTVRHQDGNTIVQYGDTTVTVEGVEATAEQLLGWDRAQG